ncbi:hypothetical protein L6164_012565 [Bauhinia variegata]|uniref:Uncharacterized protein n=1 Tax=Bauhinia variegata TaxID=167791 RepID=A0ACB9PFM3_BAUVA|nr:hypothetical protein L6164_012565 [Bauhinia variegata]
MTRYDRDIVSWTSMIIAYVENAPGHHALQLFREFNHLSLGSPSHFMLSSAINACARLGSLGSGKITHGVVIHLGYDVNVVISSALVEMYCKCGSVVYSNKVFKRITNPSVITFSSMIFGAANCGHGILSLEHFQEMIDKRIKPNNVTFVAILHACASLGSLVSGKITHGVVTRLGYDADEVISSALVDMYGKCGSVDYSNKVFRRIPNPSVIDFTSMIASAARCGHGILSLELFQEMIDKGIKPDVTTFAAVLHACASLGILGFGEIIHGMVIRLGYDAEMHLWTCMANVVMSTSQTRYLGESFILQQLILIQ